jgi:drug/metabolite transporter (DMT)-like permease
MSTRLRHTTTGRWRLGLALGLLTLAAWSTLPAALKAALEHLDPLTLTWFRFFVATLVMGAWVRDRAPRRIRRLRGGFGMLLLASAMLTADYILYLIGLDMTTPAVAQVLIQLALVLMAVGGIWFFGERFSTLQWGGFITLMAGLAIFFHRQLAAFASEADRFAAGAALIVAAGIAWAVYALVQKQLLIDYSSNRIMLFIYAFATLTLLPFSKPLTVLDLDPRGWAVVGYCALNTLVAYGAFAEALNHWEASRVSALLAVTPLGTIGFAQILERIDPETASVERLDWVSLLGASLVVAGSIATSLAGHRVRPTPPGEAGTRHDPSI